jgi:hypothetical protein
LETQPKQAVTEEGKSSLDVAYELADVIMEKIYVKIDRELCNLYHLEVI